MKTNHIYRIASNGWWHCHDRKVEAVAPWPRLSHGALVVLDVDDIFSDVWRFEGKSEYAAALIEKRVRTEGLVDGISHIVIHRLVKQPDGFQVFFSAVPLELWQQCTQWAKEQEDHCILLLAPGLLCHNVKNEKARLVLTQRRVMCFAQMEDGMAFASAQALGASVDDMAGTVQALLMSSRKSLLSRLQPAAVEWGTLWSLQTEDSNTCLEALSDALGGTPVVMPSQEMQLAEKRLYSVLPSLLHEASGQHALNPGIEKMAWRAERWLIPIAAITSFVGIGLAISGVFVAQVVEQQQVLNMAQQSELNLLQERIQAVAQVEIPKKVLPLTDFSRAMAEGARYDPVAFMALLKAAAGSDLRIQRIRLESPKGLISTRAFRVDGRVASGNAHAVTRWVTQMVAAGWKVKAIEPALAVPGAFSYELIAAPQPALGS